LKLINRSILSPQIDREQTEVKQPEDRCARVSAQDFERVRKPSEWNRGPLGESEDAERQPRPVRKSGDQSLDRSGLIQELSDLIGVSDRADPREVRFCTLREPDRRQARSLVTAKGQAEHLARLGSHCLFDGARARPAPSRELVQTG
jgi:hypothetical protein